MSKMDDLISDLDTAAGMLLVASMKDETVRAAMEKITHVSVELGIIASGEGTEQA
ncbi:hypothetical protein [Paenibacillus mesophilus]|uniref:hypothetical protein n=1 Tax=Paenibacillus mesophilus TaxID=2582849 RepID=UPI0013053EF3|nr:hypothetical protein [Paenibacillus mesophilus]